MSDQVSSFKPLQGIRVVTIALNVPGPIAADKLAKMGAEVIKIEPPTGDPLSLYAKEWYQKINQQQQIIMCDLKTEQGKAELFEILKDTDLLITAQRPAALKRLGLSWQQLNPQLPKLSYVSIVGYTGEKADKAGHDITYLAGLGLLSPPQMPKTLMADLAGAEQAVSAAVAALFQYERSKQSSFVEVVLEAAALEFVAPLSFGVTNTGGMLSGALAEYSLYETAKGWLAVAALEPHFKARMVEKLELEELNHKSLGQALMKKTAREWEAWGKSLDIPFSEVH